MAYVFDFQNTLIEITSPQTDVDIQELIDEIRTVEATSQGIAYPRIADASGKESLSAGVNVGITVELQNGWQLHFWEGAYTATVTGGNLVGGPAGDPVAYSAGVQVVLVQSAASTIVSTGGSALTQEEHDELFAVADNVWDELLTGDTHNIATSAGRRLRQLGDVISASVNDSSPTLTTFITDLTESRDDFYVDQLVRFVTDNLQGLVRPILAYDGTTKAITISEDLPELPDNGMDFDIIPTHVHPMEEISNTIWDEQLGGYTTTGSAGRTLSDTQTGIIDALGISGENVKWSGMAFDSNNNLISAVVTQYTDNTLTVERKKWQLTATYDANSRLTSYQMKEY